PHFQENLTTQHTLRQDVRGCGCVRCRPIYPLGTMWSFLFWLRWHLMELPMMGCPERHTDGGRQAYCYWPIERIFTFCPHTPLWPSNVPVDHRGIRCAESRNPRQKEQEILLCRDIHHPLPYPLQ
ncbi:unnamed protein product, partial [Ectocarpus sp. 8 AP-2014]